MIILWVIVAVILLFGFVVLFGAPYVPTLNSELTQAFTKLYPVGKQDVVVDLGSGDGRVLAAAVSRGATAYGYELNPLLVVFTKLRLGRRANVQLRDMWTVALPADTTLVYVFTVSRDGRRLGRFLQSQVNKRGRALSVMTFGPTLKGYTPVSTHRGHSLYELHPSK